MDCDSLKVWNQTSFEDRTSWLPEPSFKVKQTTVNERPKHNATTA
jgi:hypothetical protein